MPDTVIQVENLGKKYVIGHQQAGAYQYTALRDVIADGMRSLGRKLRQPNKLVKPSNREEFWALKDVSFEVKRGEVIGIIGRNGAGKSTLLKILSRITEPTTGRVKLKGRVASLLEVGTGFHPELTGRENIFLNGAILGMSKAEINHKFDEIVEFAEVSRFLDTPVKRYSSGMYVRLAFAVAAHLEPEILVIDEVLAVGDTAFQKKCLGKMNSVAQEGRTILFVSHNLDYMRKHVRRGLLINEGGVVYSGQMSKTLNLYQSAITSYKLREQNSTYVNNNFNGSGIICANLTVNDHQQISIQPNDKLQLKVTYCITSETRNLEIGFGILLEGGEWLFGGNSKHFGLSLEDQPGKYLLSIIIPSFPFYSTGRFFMNLYFGYIGDSYQILENAFVIKGETKDIYSSGHRLDENYCKVTVPNLKFEVSSCR
ncbi:MAG: polysaccharide ABC transporter ATP-binding protein [Cyanobacteria bacterium P01_C01_bin.120]